MKILAFADPHSSSQRISNLHKMIKLQKPDLLLCSGDITWLGQKLDDTLKKLNSFNIPLIMVHGNHEAEEEVEKISEKYKNLIFVHKKMFEFQGYQFFGFGSGGFALRNKAFEENFAKIKSKIKNNKKFIFIPHQPPYKTKLDKLGKNYHVGSISVREFIELTSPILVITGHIHENEHCEDKIKSSRIINPGDGEFITL